MIYSRYPILVLCTYANLLFVTSGTIDIGNNQKYAVAKTKSGETIIGTKIAYDGKTINRFLGIPFALPPVGDLRFRKTVPLKGLPGMLIANRTRDACSQDYPIDYDLMDNMPGRSEDCLYLNIWAPADASRDNLKAVMVWLFAGGFSTGSNRLETYDGTVLAALGDVIVVTPNYRLGIFGFLSTDSEKAPGNMGLYDVLEALKWVNSYINAFGGDKRKVTIAGNTAGSLIAGLCTISPLTPGLFHRVIMESGADITDRGNIKQNNLEIGQQVATMVGCASESQTLQNDPETVIKCLKTKTSGQLVNATNVIMKKSIVSFLPFYGDPFLPETPSIAYKNGYALNVSVMIGDVRDEGTFNLVTDYAYIFGPYGNKYPVINKTYGAEIIDDGLKKDSIGSNGRRQIIYYYLSKVSDNNYYGIRHQVGRALGDVNVYCNDYYFGRQFSNRVAVYYFYFIHPTPITKFANWTGVTIFSEVPYVFGVPLHDSRFTEEEAQLSKIMVRYWTNFVKGGVPSDDWEKFNGSDPDPYVEILQVKGDVNDDPHQRFKSCRLLSQYLLSYDEA